MNKYFIIAILVEMFFIKASYGGQLKRGNCYYAQQFGYEIVSKVDKNTYELAGNFLSPHAILSTKETSFKGTGRFGLTMKLVGTKTIELENGFEAEFLIWEECPKDFSPERNNVK